MYDCAGPSGKNIDKTPTSAYKRKTIRQKIGVDANYSFSRMVTRSISKKNSHTMPKEDEKAPTANIVSPIANPITPVRRSARLYNCKK